MSSSLTNQIKNEMSTLKVWWCWSSSPIINFDQLISFGSDSKVQLPFLVLLEVRRRKETSDGSIDFSLREKNVGLIIDYRDFCRKSSARLFQFLLYEIFASKLLYFYPSFSLQYQIIPFYVQIT